MEGWHVHLRAALLGYSVGAELADAILMELLVRRSFICGVNNKGDVSYGVNDPEPLDELKDIVAHGACKAAGIDKEELVYYERTRHVPDDKLEQMGASRCHSPVL